MTEDGTQPVRELRDDPPPFLRTWPRIYAVVLCYAALLITTLYLLTRYFRY